MKHSLYIISFVLLIDLCFQNCANPGRPSGGPKDTIPPILVYSIPENGTTNFQGTTLELEFSEYVNADKLIQQLIITPNSDIQYKSLVKRNKLIVKLEGKLQDSTTYNFNFANGITDITEKNPAVNLSIAFSTGPFIDSMSIQGSIETLLDKEPGKEYVVGLYPFSDTLDLLVDKPMYFTTANDSGKYELNYIKTGKYKIISFSDENENFLLDPETEAHAFLEETINLDSSTTLKPMRSLLQNVKPLVLINTRSIGNYVEIKFNKQVDSYSLEPSIPSNQIGENKDVIRLYKTPSLNHNDSLTSRIQASDSLGNQVIDTIKYVFLESNRKPSNFSYSTNVKDLYYEDNPSINFLFNKPIQSFDTTKISIYSDSTFLLIPSYSYNWNDNRTQLKLQLNSPNSLFDSLRQNIALHTNLTDSSTQSPPLPGLSFISQKAAFISVDSDSSSTRKVEFKETEPKSTGVLKVELDTKHPLFRFQLLDKNGKVSYEEENNTSFAISSVKAGEYIIRILIDSNQDGKWSYGNLIKNEEPEEVFIYEQPTSIRENWVVELSISF